MSCAVAVTDAGSADGADIVDGWLLSDSDCLLAVSLPPPHDANINDIVSKPVSV